VTVVADKDRQAALTKVQTEARRLAEDEFKKESGNGTYLISTGNLRTLTSTYSAQVGAEATELSLELKVQAEALSYRSDDLLPLAAAALSDQVPAGYTLSSDRPQVLSQPVENATGSAATSIAANISSQALPQLNPDQIKDSLKGLPIAQAQSQLVGQSEIETASVEITPSLSRFIVRSMPTDSTRIRVRITP
jgi:hypothetical protein